MATKRLFIATFAECNRFESTYSRFIEMSEKFCSGKWVEPENLHVTYKFLGSVDESKIPKIQEVLTKITKTYDIPLTMKGLGVLPNLETPEILYSKLLFREATLFKISIELEKLLKRVGFKKGREKFHPHITFLRIKSYDKENFAKYISRYEHFEFCKMKSFKVHLVSSELTHERPNYTIIQ